MSFSIRHSIPDHLTSLPDCDENLFAYKGVVHRAPVAAQTVPRGHALD